MLHYFCSCWKKIGYEIFPRENQGMAETCMKMLNAFKFCINADIFTNAGLP